MTAAVTLLAVVVGLLGVLVAGLLRSHAEVLRTLHDMGVNLDPARAEGPEQAMRTAIGVPRPRTTEGLGAVDLAGESPAGDPVAVAVLGAQQPTLLAFLSSTCLTCRGFWQAFADADLEVPAGARLVAVTKGAEAESPSTLKKLAPPHVTTVMTSEAWERYGVPVAPYFVLVDGQRRQVVGEGAATTWEQVRHLLDQSLADEGEHRLARERRVDAELRSAGIEPGDPSLHPPSHPDHDPA